MKLSDLQNKREEIQQDPRWDAALTVVWTFLIISIWQTLVARYVTKKAHELGMDTQGTDWLKLPVISDALFQAIILGGLSCIFMVMAAIRLKKDSQIWNYLPIKAVSVFEVLKWLILAMLVTFAWGAFTKLLGLENTRQMEELVVGAKGQLMMYLAIAVVAPLAEEFLFRGFVISGFERLPFKGPPLVAVFVSALAWTLLHLQYNAHEMFQVFLLGLVLGLARIKTGSMLTPILIHIINNALAISVLAFGLN